MRPPFFTILGCWILSEGILGYFGRQPPVPLHGAFGNLLLPVAGIVSR
jgi:hypothetical protein